MEEGLGAQKSIPFSRGPVRPLWGEVTSPPFIFIVVL